MLGIRPKCLLNLHYKGYQIEKQGDILQFCEWIVTIHGQGYEKPIGAMVSSASLFRRHLLRSLLFYITLKVLLQRSAS